MSINYGNLQNDLASIEEISNNLQNLNQHRNAWYKREIVIHEFSI